MVNNTIKGVLFNGTLRIDTTVIHGDFETDKYTHKNFGTSHATHNNEASWHYSLDDDDNSKN